jgi:HEAT repeat protein
LRDSRAFEPLMQMLEDRSESVRAESTRALGKLGDANAVTAITRLLADSESTVRIAAAEALANLGQRKWLKRVKGAPEDFERLGESKDPDVFDALMDALNARRDYYSFEGAIVALGRLGDPRALEPLVQILEHPSFALDAARALGKLGDPRAVEPLIRTLGHANGSVRLAAAEALSQLGEPDWLARLSRADHSQHFEGLGASGDRRAVVPLVWALQTLKSDRRQRRLAARALGELGSADGMDALLEGLRDLSGDVHDLSTHVAEAAAEALGRLGDLRAVEPLLQAIRDRSYDSALFSGAAKAFGMLGDVRAVEPLIELLRGWAGSRSRDFEVNAAARALGKIHDPRALEPLICALECLDSHWVVESLCAFGDRAVEPLISTLLGSSSHPAAANAAEALGRLGDIRAVEPLISTLQHQYHNARRAAAEALGELGDARAVEPLISALQRPEADSSVRGAIDASLVRLNREK